MKKRKLLLMILCLLLTVAIIAGCADNTSAVNDTSDVSEISDNGSTVLENTDLSEDIQGESADESQSVSVEDNTADEDIEISGIKWWIYKDEGRFTYYNAVRRILDNEDRIHSEAAWATVILESLTPIGTRKTEGDFYYCSIAEIKILDIHYYGKDLKDVAESGDTIKIIVPYTVNEDGEIFPYIDYDASKYDPTYTFPMTEIGKKYVVAFYEYASSEKIDRVLDTLHDSHKKAISVLGMLEFVEKREKFLEDNGAADIKLSLLTSYPMFSMDISSNESLNKVEFEYCWLQMYVATYDRYMKGNVSEDSAETKFYDIFKEIVYHYFGLTPEKPTGDKTDN